jgi:parvulin-like peptidyl-prolyl isomerase
MLNGNAGKVLAVIALLGIAAVIFLKPWSSSSPGYDAADVAVATVAGRIITSAEFSQQMTRRSGGFQNQFTTMEQKQALLAEMIERELQIAHAQQAGYERDPKIIAVLESAMIAKLREEQLATQLSALVVSDAEIERYFMDNQQAYTTPAMKRIAIIRFELPSGASDDKTQQIHATAESVLAQARNLDASARGFGALAARHSRDQASRYVGGDIGWIAAGSKNRFDHESVNQAIGTLSEPGSLSDLVQTSDSLYLIKLLQTRSQKTRDIEQVSESIRRHIMGEKRAEAEAAWLASLEDQANPVEIYETVLESVPSPSGNRPLRQQAQPPKLPRG